MNYKVRKKTYIVFIILLIFCQYSCLKKSALDERHNLSSSFYPEKVIIDGSLSEWAAADSVEITDRNGLSKNILSLRSHWDNDFLYLGFRVADSDLRAYQTQKDHKELYLDDMVEFLIDANHDATEKWSPDDIVYHINLLGQKKDDRGTPTGKSDATWDGNVKYAIEMSGTLNDTTDTDEGYTVEVAIPWSELGVIPYKNLIVGLNFANGDNDGKGRQLFDWVSASPFRSPDVFGDLILE